MFTPPAGARPWPASQSEPTLGGGLGPLELEDGLYYWLWPSGALRLMARVTRGQIEEWVSAAESQDCGCHCSENYPRSAQRYYSNGTQEDFSPWDDDSPAYPAEQPFAVWLARVVGSVGRTRVEHPQLTVERVDRSELPVPDSHQAFSLSEVPANLEELVKELEDVRWTSSLQCYERLVNWGKWDLRLARDFTNLAPHACASVISPRAVEAAYELPNWLGPDQPARGNLEEVPLYLQLRQLAQSKASWVVSLAQFLPGSSCGDRGQRVPHCLIWTTPSEPIDPFWMAMHCVSLRLRQEAGAQGLLGSSLQKLDSQRFFQLGGLVGALLQAPAFTGCWFFDPGLAPDCSPYLDDLARLLQEWAPFTGPNDSSRNHWQKAPLLASLGQWVNLQCGADEPDPVLWQLARFIQKDRNNLRSRLAALPEGLLCWDEWCHDWPGVYNSEPSSMVSYWKGLGIRMHERAQEFVANPATEQLLQNPEPARFAYRVQLVGHHLTRSLDWTNEAMQQQAKDLERDLREHPGLSSQECLAFEQAILGRPLKPGPVFSQALQACRWSFQPWLKPGVDPVSTIFPALRILFDLLSEF